MRFAHFAYSAQFPISSCGVASVMAVLVAASGAQAQWSSDPANNLRIVNHPGEQTQAKLVATADGGAYIAWFDNGRGGGYDVYMQRVDSAGIGQWAANGVLVADRGVSSTVDYDLIVDAQGNALVTYNDDQAVPGTQQISVSKVSPAGAILWTSTVTSGSTSKNNPRIVQIAGGEYIVGYSNGASPSNWIMQKLDSAGQPQWPAPGITHLEAGRALVLCDLKASGSGYIALWMRAAGTNPILSNKGLATQKYDANGAALWNGGEQVIIVDSFSGSGSIQSGYFPTFLSDGAGGGVYGWYEVTTGARNAYLQHVLADGTRKFPSNLATTGPGAPATRIRLGAGLAYDLSSGNYYIASPESDASPQGNYSVVAQKFSAAGNRLWGDSGTTILAPVGTNQPSFVQAQAIPGGSCFVFYMDTRDVGGTRRVVEGSRVDGGGTVAWRNLVNSDDTTDKGRLTSAMSTQGFAMIAYTWGSGSGADIGLQNMNIDGTLGLQSCYANCDGSTTAPVLNVDDFTCFINAFAIGQTLPHAQQVTTYANCDGSTTAPALNVDDFTCFINGYALGCR
jgi:hypothetical protein